MIVATHNNLRDPLQIQATRALITADDGTPVCLVVQFRGGPQSWLRVFRAGDKDFEEQLRLHGVTATVQVNNLDLHPSGRGGLALR